ncbi:MAG: PAS domain S-box protein, partial [Longimicrobiales bacterium]
MSAETLRVLVVESDPGRRATFEAALADNGGNFKVVAADHLNEALDRLRAEPYDVVLADLDLPEAHGLGTFAALYATAADTPIVVLAEPADEATALKAVKAGAQDYLLAGQVHGTLLTRALRYAVERRRSEEQIRLQARLLEAVGQAVIATDRDGIVRYWNRFAERLYGWSVAEAVGRPIEELIVPERSAAFSAHVMASVLAGVEWSGEMELRRRNGTVFPGTVTTSPIHDSNGEMIGVVGVSGDISDRKRAEEKLRANEQRLRLFVQQAPAILWSTDRELRFTSFAGAGLAAAGLDPHDMLGADVGELGRRTKLEGAVIDAHRRAVAGERISDRLRFRDHIFEAHVEPLHGADGEVDGTIGIAFDVTDHERMEEQLRRSEERFRSLVENGSDMIAVIGGDLRIRYVSPSVRAILGYSTDDLVGRNAYELVEAADRAKAVAVAQRIRRNPRVMPTVELRARHRDGTYRTIEVKARNMLHDPAMAGLVVNARDITERTLAREALRESNETLRALITASPLAIVALDAGGRVTMWNPSAERMFGWRESEVLGSTLPIMAEEDNDQFRTRLAATLEGHSYTGVEIGCRRRDGGHIDVSVSAAPLRDGQRRVRGTMAMLEDLTPRKELEERLLHSQKMEAIGRLAGGVAHDFNNLLTAITGHSQLLLESLGQDEEARADVLEIDHAATRAAALTKQLLAFSRKQVLQPTVLDVNALVAGIERLLRRVIGEDIELVTVLHPATGRIKADPGQIEQVIMNLVVNARDAMPAGGHIVIETANTAVTADDPAPPAGVPSGDYVQLTITDSGVGMDRETLSHVFEPFFTTK